MDDTTTLFLGLFFGSIGFGFSLYGKKQHKIIPLLTGLTLMVFPYFVPNLYLLAGIGITLMALPYFFRL
ncbi:hypothetical protein [Ghiorsea bivora]|uniref:hypothetical protein n=1 Tax=Ghiorsea bivora TaxID=1485545 RepID=UPI0005713770|nr:hypothetical protein [Ghiorsea bivora]